MKIDMTHLSSCRNVISMDHTATAVSSVVWLVLPFKERNNFHAAQLSLCCI